MMTEVNKSINACPVKKSILSMYFRAIDIPALIKQRYVSETMTQTSSSNTTSQHTVEFDFTPIKCAQRDHTNLSSR